MKTAHYGLLLAALLSLTALVAACGSDDDDDNGDSQASDTPSDERDGNVSETSGEITTTKGLSVAAVNAGFGPQGGDNAASRSPKN